MLVVDDDQSMREVVCSCLKRLGFENVTEASDGSIAWEMIVEALDEGRSFEVIISDVKMEEMDGIELLRKVREDDRTTDTPFIILTAFGEMLDVCNAIQAKVSSYIAKPFKTATLQAKLSSLYLAKKKL